MFLAMISFVFISTTALSISKSLTENSNPKSVLSAFTKIYPQNPVLKEGSSFPVLSAQGVLAVDVNSGISLYEKNPDAPLLPASTTKIITALVALDTYKLDEILTVPKGVGVDGQKMGLFTGEQMKFEDLLYGLLVYSANDAAMTLAIDYPTASGSGVSSYDAFVSAMNKKAADLSMTNSHFANPVGLDEDGQRSTAKDLVRASEVAMRNTEFANVVGTKEITVKDVSGKFIYPLKNINELLGNVPGILGVKTGWTENARENLVTYVERDGHGVMIAILGSQDRFGETKELVDWVFGNYEWQEVKVTTLLNSTH